jgi:hypothetical protein
MMPAAAAATAAIIGRGPRVHFFNDDSEGAAAATVTVAPFK